jgi:hypothetical protein
MVREVQRSLANTVSKAFEGSRSREAPPPPPELRRRLVPQVIDAPFSRLLALSG